MKSANAEKSFLLNWKNMFTSQLLITKNKNRYIAIFGILPEIIQSVMPALFLIIGIKLIINNSLSLGSLIVFCFYSNNGYEANSKFGFLL
ncbi:hypothetical protein [Enterococcus faecalis]|uniref:hypothetical protein n=1 Tax=Enterococcus faecalis TaxID=1351 RepID=UPI001F5B7A8E|nr:hypothetical protein [Enterococcus faecalis]